LRAEPARVTGDCSGGYRHVAGYWPRQSFTIGLMRLSVDVWLLIQNWYAPSFIGINNKAFIILRWLITTALLQWRHQIVAWPIEGTDEKLGLKEIRNKLIHGVHGKINFQALAVASWHFSIFIERLIFVMVEAEVPKGICRNSLLLTRNDWYGRDYWTSLQKPTLKNILPA